MSIHDKNWAWISPIEMRLICTENHSKNHCDFWHNWKGAVFLCLFSRPDQIPLRGNIPLMSLRGDQRKIYFVNFKSLQKVLSFLNLVVLCISRIRNHLENVSQASRDVCFVYAKICHFFGLYLCVAPFPCYSSWKWGMSNTCWAFINNILLCFLGFRVLMCTPSCTVLSEILNILQLQINLTLVISWMRMAASRKKMLLFHSPQVLLFLL